jgi:hypothetical protein
MGFEPGSSDLFDRFFGTFLIKKNVETKRWHKMKKIKLKIKFKIFECLKILK